MKPRRNTPYCWALLASAGRLGMRRLWLLGFAAAIIKATSPAYITLAAINVGSTSSTVAPIIRVVLRPPASGAYQTTNLIVDAVTAQWTAQFTGSQAEFGRAIAGAGDVDNDGFPDMIVGARLCSASARQVGQILVFNGSAQGLSQGPRWAFTSTQARGMLGNAVGGNGDVNGDGIVDVIAGAYRQYRSLPGEGQTLLFYGTNVFAAKPNWVTGGSNEYGLFGCSVSIEGDVNGDGFNDILVGAPRHAAGKARRGAAKIFYGSSSGPGPKPDWLVVGDEGAEEFGYSVAYAGDVNRDGYDDVLIGAPTTARANGSAVGEIYLYFGSPNGPSTNPVWTLAGIEPSERFGESVAAAGDINNDGFADIIVGAPGTQKHGENRGRAYLFMGSTNGFDRRPSWVAEGEHGLSQFGSSVSSAGDVNHDGFVDLLIGAPEYAGGGGATSSDQGRAYLYLGSVTGPEKDPVWTADGGQAGAQLGWCVSGVGDLNRDGFDDFALGAPFYDYGLGSRRDQGRVDVFYGSATAFQRSNAVVALMVGGAAVGALEVLAPKWSAPMVILGFGMICLLFVAVWRFRGFRAHALIAAERARMARDLHDEVGPHITQLTMLSTPGVGGSAHPSDGPSSAGAVSDTAREMARALEQAVWGLSPGKDSLEDLVSFLGLQAGKFFAGSKIRCLLDLPSIMPECRVSAEVRRSLPLVVKEILNNVAKHSEATEVSLTVRLDRSTLSIVIDDNGRGIAAKGVSRGLTLGAGGNGLPNIQSRMKELQGEVYLERGPEGGTRVKLKLDL